MANRISRSFTSYFLMILMLFQGLSGIAGGIGLVNDPTGRSMHIPMVWLNQSPFNDYLIPGLILLVILGVFPTIIFFGLLRQKSWAWLASLLVAIALIIWIVVEIMIIGYQSQPPLQLIYGLVGIVMLISVLSPSVKMKYQSIK